MNLLQQFQGVLGSLLLGGLFYFGLTLINVFLKHRFLYWIYYIFTPLYFFVCVILYYLFLCYFTYGIYNFFFTISLFLGMIIYHILYLPGINKLLLPVKNKIDIKMKKIKVKKFHKKKKRKKNKKTPQQMNSKI